MKATYQGYDATLEYEPLADAFKVLSHSTRIAILNLLIRHGSLKCGEIVEKIPRSQSTVSQHLQELFKEGFVEVKTRGPERIYKLNEKRLNKSIRKMETFIHQLANANSGNE